MHEQQVYLIDDDDPVRDALAVLLELDGIKSLGFASGEAFLSELAADWCGCALVDLKMPGRDGLQVHAEMVARNAALPVVIMTEHGDVATVRTAFKAGVHDFLEKPLEPAVLLDVIHSVFDLDQSRRRRRDEIGQLREKADRLTRRERQVMQHLSEGH